MSDQFIGEPLKPDAGSFDPAAMAAGEPGLPARFTWRGEPVEVRAVVNRWRGMADCRHGSGERYVHRHWYEVATAGHGVMKLYCERQTRGGKPGLRWWVYSVRGDAERRLNHRDKEAQRNT